MRSASFCSCLWRLATTTVAAIASVTLLTAGSKFPQTPQLERESVTAHKQTRANTSAPASEPNATSVANSALRTQQGRSIESKARDVSARRISAQPDDIASLSYNEASTVRGLVGADPEQRLNLPLADGRVEWSVLDEDYHPIPLQRTRGDSGGFHLAGVEGSSYMLRFRNLSDFSYQVIATVDGLDVIGGQPSTLHNSGGYMLGPQQWLTIRGFRKSNQEEAAFRFSMPGSAYAANTEAGDVLNIGVIGVTLFKVQVRGTRATDRISRTHTP